MLNAIKFAPSLRVRIFAVCGVVDVERLGNVSVSALDTSTLELLGKDLAIVERFADFARRIIVEQHAFPVVVSLLRVSRLAGFAVVVTWREVGSVSEHTERKPLPRTGVKKAAIVREIPAYADFERMLDEAPGIPAKTPLRVIRGGAA